MRIEAAAGSELAGYLRRGDRLRVTGVFSSAVYFENPRGGTLMLYDESFGLVPFGVGVRDARGLIAASDFAVSGDGEALDGAVRLQSCVLHLSVRPRRETARARPDAETLRAAAENWRGLLSETRKGSLWSEELIFAAASARKRAELYGALQNGSYEDTLAALGGLLGLGTGLTPSLDDYLSALCTLLIWTREAWDMPECGAQLLSRGIKALAPAKTSRISAAYLLASASGQRSERLEDALAAPESVAAARALLDVGAGSGGDMLAGLAAGLEYVLGRL